MQRKKPNRRPNATCVICSQPFYAQPSIKRSTCSMACRSEHYRRIQNYPAPSPMERNHFWKGGRTLHQGKYWLVKVADHPNGDHRGYVREHHLVMEQALGRYLLPGEVVHHRNHVTTDNRLENLELFASNADHKRSEHLRGENPVSQPRRSSFSETPTP